MKECTVTIKTKKDMPLTNEDYLTIAIAADEIGADELVLTYDDDGVYIIAFVRC